MPFSFSPHPVHLALAFSPSLLYTTSSNIVNNPPGLPEDPTTATMAEENTAPVIDEVKVDEVKVDESSINHPSAARRNSLEKLIAHRPDRTQLVESRRPQ